MCKQTVETLIRGLVLWRLICVCAVCLCPQKDARPIWVNIASKCIFMNALYYMGHDTRIPVSGVCEQQMRRPACTSRSRISAFIIRLLESIISRLATSKISIFSISLCRLPLRKVFSLRGLAHMSHVTQKPAYYLY